MIRLLESFLHWWVDLCRTLNISFKELVGSDRIRVSYCIEIQVRLGSEGGARVVKVAVGLLYSLVFVLGLGQTLPFSSVVSSSSSFLSITQCYRATDASLFRFWIWMFVLQVLCALTLPVGRLVAGFVEKNHKVSFM